jgi:GNAT superfamily N-acetyltransferase
LIPHVLREAAADDRAFISRKWAAEMRRSPWARCTPPDVYWPSQYKTIEALMARSRVVVAADPGDTMHLYGVIVWQRIEPRALLHWLYVKPDYRRLGLAAQLAAATLGDARPVYLTQASNFVADHPDIMQKHGLVPSPYILLGTHTEERHGRNAEAQTH